MYIRDWLTVFPKEILKHGLMLHKLVFSLVSHDMLNVNKKELGFIQARYKQFVKIYGQFAYIAVLCV